MKKFLKIFLIILLIIFIAIAVFAFIYRDKIKAIYIGYKYTTEEIQKRMDDSQDKLQKDIEDVTGIKFRSITEEEQKKIDSGELTKSEVFEIILNETIEKFLTEANINIYDKNSDENKESGKDDLKNNSGETEDETQKNKDKDGKKSGGKDVKQENSDKVANKGEGEEKKSKSSSVRDYNTIVADYTGRLYSIKGRYLGMLEGLLSQADAEFHSLPQSSWTVGNRSAIISKYIGVAGGYESACDGEVNSILASMESELNTIGADTSIVGVMRNAYYEEKSLKISYYMSQMK